MKRLFPHPLLTLALILMWMILTRFSLGQAILGTVIAIVASKALAKLEPKTVRIRRWSPIPILLFVLVKDVLASNFHVASLILSGRQPKSGVVEVDLETRNRNILAILAIIISATPGTAWLGWNPRTGKLLIHVFDLREGDVWKTLLQDRYECRLREIFE